MGLTACIFMTNVVIFHPIKISTDNFSRYSFRTKLMLLLGVGSLKALKSLIECNTFHSVIK